MIDNLERDIVVTSDVLNSGICVSRSGKDGVLYKYYYLADIGGLSGLHDFCVSNGVTLEVVLEDGKYKVSELLDSFYFLLIIGGKLKRLKVGQVFVLGRDGDLDVIEVLSPEDFDSSYEVKSGLGIHVNKVSYFICNKTKLLELVENVYSGVELDEKVQSRDYPWINNSGTRYELEELRNYILKESKYKDLE
jgi:hypothetical protein